LKKSDLAERILRRLGYPMIKVELDPQQIYDAIDYARDKFIKWAVGNAIQDTFFTLMLSGGQSVYDLDAGVVDVVNYIDEGDAAGGINTLFTIENYLYNRGIFDPVLNNMEGGYISYHLALDFLKTADRYSVTKFGWRYHHFTNQLEIIPAPDTGNTLSVYNATGGIIEVDSPGFALVRAYMIEGSTITNGWSVGDSDEQIYGSTWILDFATAECKITLGRIRNKFGNFAAMGNTGISLDGSDLIAEGKEEKEQLRESLKNEEVYEGYGIYMG